MERKIPSEAFDFYAAMGVKRSYSAVAEKFGVTKVAVVNCAKRERWQERLEQIESKARASSDAKALQSREELSEHYIAVWKAAERRALEGLRNYPITSALDAARVLHMATRNVLLLRGEPTERVESVETIVRREYERWMTRADDAEGGVSSEGRQATRADESTVAADACEAEGGDLGL
jgi:hypothetical protein